MDLEVSSATLSTVPENAMIDISVILLKSGISLSGLQDLCVAPALDDYRRAIDVEEDVAGMYDSSQLNLSEFDGSIEAQRIRARASYIVPSAAADEDFGCFNDAEHDDDFDYGGDDIENDLGDDGYSSVQTFDVAKLPTKSLPAAPKLDWTAAFGDSVDAGSATSQIPSTIPLESVEVTIGNDYTFLNFQSNQSNSWAGARHWKFATRRSERSVVSKSSTEEEQHTETSSKSLRPQEKAVANKPPKEKNFFSFDKATDFSAAFKVEDKKSSNTVLTSAAIEKSKQLANEGAFTLPMDAKLGPKDLCRLFLCPSMIVPPPNLTSIMSSSSNTKESKSIESMTSGRQDCLWGELQPEVRAKLGNFAATAVAAKVEDDGCQDYDYLDDDENIDSGDYSMEAPNGHQTARLSEDDVDGLQIRVDGMLQATRKVEKVNIG
jgi:hypothetical protein